MKQRKENLRNIERDGGKEQKKPIFKEDDIVEKRVRVRMRTAILYSLLSALIG